MQDVTPTEDKPKPAPSAGTLGVLRIFGVPVRFHFTFILLLIFLLVIGVGERQSGVMTALYVLALFASVLLHEIGHALVAGLYGIRTTEIVMYPIGGVSRPERIPKGREEFWIAISGPLVNGLIAAGLFAWLATRHQFLPFELLKRSHRCQSRPAYCHRKLPAVPFQSAARLSHGWRPNPAFRAHALQARGGVYPHRRQRGTGFGCHARPLRPALRSTSS